MNWRDSLAAWLSEQDTRCPYCRSRSDCHPACPERKCPECAGLGAVIDLNKPYGVTEDGNFLYGGKPCPRGCDPISPEQR